jgi:putative ABC transport system substrate-binding protein
LQQVTRALPIVFVQTTDPVGGGYVASLARPGGNATGFMTTEYSMSGKWLEVLKQIAPSVARVAVLRDPAIGISGSTQFAVLQALAPSLRMEVIPVDVRDVGRAVTAFARGSNGGLIVTSSRSRWTARRWCAARIAVFVRDRADALLISADPFFTIRRHQIVALAARDGLPVVYPWREYAEVGGLMSYGPSLTMAYREIGLYAGRILKGAPTKARLSQTKTRLPNAIPSFQ